MAVPDLINEQQADRQPRAALVLGYTWARCVQSVFAKLKYLFKHTSLLLLALFLQFSFQCRCQRT